MLTGGSCKNIKTGVTWDLLEDLVRKLYATFWTTPKKSYNGIDVIKACIIISISACDTVGLSFAIFLSWKKKKHRNESYAVVLKWFCYYVIMWKDTSGDFFYLNQHSFFEMLYRCWYFKLGLLFNCSHPNLNWYKTI